MDIKISDIDINVDTLANVKDIEAKENANEAKKRLLNAKVKLQEEMADAIKKGNFNLKDYQKEKHIFDSFDEKDLPYSTE